MDSSYSKRKDTIRDHADRVAGTRDGWIERNRYYYENDYRYMRFLIPEGLRILDLGCGTGRLLSELRPAKGVGVDLSARVARLAFGNALLIQVFDDFECGIDCRVIRLGDGDGPG